MKTNERLDKIEKFLFNYVKHELRWHRILLLIILAAVIGGAITNIATG